MKQIKFKSILPHLIAVLVFLVVAVIFCKPALESGVVIQQSDVTAVESMKHQSELYKQEHGVYPLWISSMFSGMPAYNIIFDGPISPFQYINKTLQLWLPKPLNFFFLSCICFYIFCMCIRIRPYVAIFASLAFAYSTYNPILVVAGHDTKLLAMAYVPALLGSIILLYDKKYISGFMLTAVFATLHLMQNHQQISYYAFLIIAIMSFFYLIKWIREKEFVHIGKAVPLAIGAALFGVMINAIILFPVYDFAKYSKRGGQLVMDSKAEKSTDKIEKNKTQGLSRDYAFQWSNDRIEGLTLLFPGIKGYGTYFSKREEEYNIFPKLADNSAVSTYLSEKLNVPGDQAENIAANLSGKIYWGDKPFTSGPAYLGAVICCLFVLGLFLLDGKHKWWILSASILGIILAMGKNFPAINNFLFDYLPFYNKFRTPEMALVIPQFLFPMLSVMAVQKLTDIDFTANLKVFKFTAISMSAIFALAAILYFSFDYSKENKQRTAAINTAFAKQDSSLNDRLQSINQQYPGLTDNQVYEDFIYQTKGDTKVSKDLLNALRTDRQTFFRNDLLRSFLFVFLTLVLIGLSFYKKINSSILLTGLTLLVLIDLLPMGMHYINEKSFDSAEKYQANEFTASDADKTILQDKYPNFRVYDMSGGDPYQDSKPSYFHKSIGGYHPAKIGIYDDLITYQLSGQPNTAVLNMLNAKYIIQKSSDGKTAHAIQNPGAMGNCWFVNAVKFVDGPVAEMRALDNLNPKDTAVIDNSYKNIVTGFAPADSTSSIKETSFDNMAIKYKSSSNSANLAVFSEIFYKDWNATIDGKPVPVAKANYVLRALVIPAGKHIIEFKFEPSIFKTSYTISLITNWLLFVMLIGFGFYAIKKSGNKKELDA